MMKHILCLLFGLLLCACADESNSPFIETEDFCSKIQRNDSLSLSQELASVQDSMKHKTGVYVLEDGGGSLITRAWLCEYAEKTIDIQYFIFSTDNVGLIACDYLVRAADRGVKVRILVDDIMVNADIEDIQTLNAHQNITIKIYNPGVNLGKSLLSKLKKAVTDLRSVNQRMHNKTFIVDGKVVITGGRNVADEYFDYDHEYNFRDRDVFLIGKVVKNINTSFEEYWSSDLSVPTENLIGASEEMYSDPRRFDKLHAYACNPQNFWPQIRSKIDHFHHTIKAIKNEDALTWVDSVSYVSDIPGKNETTKGLSGGGLSTDALIDLVKNAKHSIDIQTPYLITTELSQNLFREAHSRGVEIRILTNSLASTDNVEAFASYQSDRKKLLSTGVRIFEYKPDAAIRKEVMTGDLQRELDFTPIFGLHSKTMVVDDKIAVIGTFNLDPRSANLNTECLTIIHSEQIAQKVVTIMDEELKPENAWEVTPSFNPDNTVGKRKRIKTWTRKILPKAIL